MPPNSRRRRTIGSVLIGFGRETGVGERRVALVPDAVARLQAIGLDLIVESGAGTAAWFSDAAYAAAGARLVDRATLFKEADVLVCLHPPAPADRDRLRAGQVLIGLLAPLFDPQLIRDLVAAKVTAISLDGLPRRLSRAQAMDALTSQSNVAGYKAALVAADAYDGYLPMLMTAAGTIRPATVLVIGAGVAGLQAISTARRLGAVVTGYDVRVEARADVASTGAAFLELGPELSAGGADGYARVLTAPERDQQRAAMVRAVGRFDIVITTAQVPGGIPPMVVSAAAVAGMAPGSVVVDISASSLGGNVEGAVPDATRGHRQRRDDHRRRQPARRNAAARIDGLLAQHRRTARLPRPGRRAPPGHRRRDHRRGARHPRR